MMLLADMMLKLIGKVVIPSLSVLAMSSFLFVGQANAVDLSSGEVEAHFDTTLSYGVTVRVEEQDKELTKQINDNDGDLNYKRGIVSNAVKFTSDLDIGYQNMGLFLRATGFFDQENENGTREDTQLTDEAKRLVGKDLDLLDAYVTASFDFDEFAVDVRFGKHVLNWGESTFIQNGINAVNPFDVSKLRVPGAELREALVAVPLVSAVMELPNNISLEAFYQLDWDKTEIDPLGTYFSTTDYVGPGAERAFISSKPLRDALALTGRNLGDDPNFLVVRRRESDRNPKDARQGGFAIRYLAEGLNNTEIGLYFMNYHSRLPTVRVRTGKQDAAFRGLGAVAMTAPTLVPHLVQRFMALGLPQAEAVDRATMAAPAAAAPFGVHEYALTGNYFIEYPEDIQLYGVSFNTQLGTSGWALQGEYSLRHDVPLQRKEATIIAEGLAPFTGCLAWPMQLGGPGACVQMGGPRDMDGRPLTVGYEHDVRGYIRLKVSQVQATATKVFGPVLGADGLAFITEAAMQYVHDMPDPDIDPLESPAEGPNADSTSFGYRMAARLDYSNVIGSANLFPYVQFQQDINGNSPQPIGQFVEGRTALTLGLRVDYLSRWEGNVSYTQYGGGNSEIRDRDFVSATIKYFF